MTSIDTALLYLLILLPFVMLILMIVLWGRVKNSKKLNGEMLELLTTSDINLGSLERELQEARAGRHDYKNHLVTLRGLIATDETAEALSYIETLISENSGGRGSISCGNAIINSILNAKAQEMKEKNIRFKNDSAVPRRLNLQPSQLTMILSNLLDNAIAAAERCSFSYIDLQLKHSKGNLVIMIKNPYEGEIIKDGANYLTTKKDTQNHGIGLKSVLQSVNRLNGTVEIEHDGGVFTVFVMVPA